MHAPEGIRPTQDKVRQAIFSALGEAVSGARALDLFAGTGAMGIEAWSRGAASVVWVESDAKSLAALRRNVAELCGADAARAIVRGDALAYAGRVAQPFDLVFADPPYDRDGTRAWLAKLLAIAGEGRLLMPRGLLVFESGADEAVPESAGWSLLWDRVYGGTRVTMWRKA